jgi:hypothetical protein
MSILEATYRTSARFELKRLDELTPEQRQPFDELARDAGFYGLLIPHAASMTVKSVGPDVAALLAALRTPSPLGPVPFDADDIVDFVLDGVLEIEHDGRFVSGAEALPVVCGAGALAAPSGLSLQALQYAQDLASDDADALSSALYLYNRIPMAPFWKARFPNRDAVLAHLGAGKLDAQWHVLPPAQANGWISFQQRERHGYVAGAPVYKLYVSPRPENIRDAFDAVVRTLAGRGLDFKIGSEAAGLLRPDKLVIYFGGRGELDDVAGALRARLAGCAAHGVPFTAAVGGSNGLLSWGVDPPDSERALSWLGRQSWRLWLADKLGAALAFAKSEWPADGWRFAVERVRRLGVDVERWTPSASLWSEP